MNAPLHLPPQFRRIRDSFVKRCQTDGERQLLDNLMVMPGVQAMLTRRGDAADLPFAARQLEYVFTEITKREYPAMAFANQADPLVPWEQTPRGAQTYVWYYQDYVTSAAFYSRAGGARNLPRVSLRGTEQHGVVLPFGNVIPVTLDQMETAAYAGVNLEADLGDASKMGHAILLNKTAAWGREDLGLRGFINGDGITVSTAATKNAGGTYWANATAAEIAADVLDLVRGIKNDSRRIYSPTVVAMPSRYLDLLYEEVPALTADGSLTTIAEYLAKALNRDGVTVRFRACEELERRNSAKGDGTYWLDTDAMIAFIDETRYVSLVVPFYYELEAPQQSGLEIETWTRSQIGGIKNPHPKSIARKDGLGLAA